MDDKVYHDIPRNVANNEALMDDNSNDGNNYVVSEDAARSDELVPYEIPGREENEEVLIGDSNYDHLNSESQVNKICKSKRQKRPPTLTKKIIFCMVISSSSIKRHRVMI